MLQRCLTLRSAMRIGTIGWVFGNGRRRTAELDGAGDRFRGELATVEAFPVPSRGREVGS